MAGLGPVLSKAWRVFSAPWRAPVGWDTRVMVLLFTFIVAFGSHVWWVFWPCVVVWMNTFWLCLATAYHRGQRDTAVLLTEGLELPEQHEIYEAVEMSLNSRMVALDDLARLCGKYGIPPDEVIPIIQRGYGLQVVGPDDVGGQGPAQEKGNNR